MQIMAVVFAVCVFTTPALAQYDPYGKILEGIFDPPKRERPDPLDYWNRQEERAERQLRMQYMHEERARQNALSRCSSIWNNPAAQAACRRSYGGY